MPVYSIIGSAISQEIIKIISKKQLPENNWFLYDSEQYLGQYFKI